MASAQGFINFIHWPTSRKTALYGAFCCALTFAAPLLWLAGVPTSKAALNVHLLEPFVLAWSAAFLFVSIVSLPAARAGKDARWTARFLVLVITPFIVGFVHLFGSMSTPMVAFFPSIVIMWALYFDEGIAWFGFGNMVFWIAVVGVLEATGALPYAPVLIERSVDAQQGNVWFSTILMANFVMFMFCFSLCLLIMAARRLQEAQLHETHQALERTNSLIRRYVPAQLVEKIARGIDGENSVPERRRLTIFSSDIQGFTHASDELDAEELAGILNEYLSEMMGIADRFKATVSHVAGDGMMIIFGAPKATGDRDHALRAVRMAQAMQQRMQELQETWFRRGFERPFRIRIGINTGVASVGDFGSKGRKLYSAVGVHVNLAARIQSFCEPGKILICKDTAALTMGEIHAVSKGEIPVKHLQNPVQVYEVAESG